MANAPHIDQLPFLIVCKILSYLSFHQRQAASLVCKVWYEATHSRQFAALTFIRPRDEENHNWDKILKSLGRWKILNLVIDVDTVTNDRIRVPSRHLSQYVTYICLTGYFFAQDVILCIQCFPNLETLKLHPKDFLPYLFLGEDKKIIESFKESLSRLPKIILQLPLPHSRYMTDFIRCLSGVRSISWESTYEPPHLKDENLFYHDNHIIQAFQKYPSILQSLDVLDLSGTAITNQDFRGFVTQLSLQLRSLTFVNNDRDGDKLMALATSQLALESLQIWCCAGGSSLRLPLILTLLSKKPSLRFFKCRHILYPTLHGGDNELVDILCDWPDIHFLEIGAGLIEGATTELDFILEMCGGGYGRTLHVKTNSLFDNLAISTLKENSPGLLALDVTPSINVSDMRGMRVVAQSFSELKVLSLGSSGDMNSSVFGLRRLSFKTENFVLGNLQVLYLYKCNEDRDLVNLQLPSLKQLWLNKASNVTDKGIISIASSNPLLELLSIGSCRKITDASITAIALHLKGLKCLFLSHCSLLNSRVAKVLVEGCQRLEFIDVGNCSPPFVDALRDLRCDLPFLQRILYSHGKNSVNDCLLNCSWGFAVGRVLGIANRDMLDYNGCQIRYGNCPP